MKFSVTVNDSPTYVVHARSPIGAVKVAFAAMESITDVPDVSKELTIVVAPLPPPGKTKGEQ